MTWRVGCAIAAALAAAAPLPGCGAVGDSTPAIVDASVTELLAAPDDFDEVRVRGRGEPLGNTGFVLLDEGRRILVLSSRTPALLVDKGEKVTVVGRLGRLDGFQVESVRREAKRGDGGGGGGQVNLSGVPLATGDPYIELINLRNEAN